MTIEIEKLQRIDLREGEYLAVHLPPDIKFEGEELAQLPPDTQETRLQAIKTLFENALPELKNRIVLIQSGIYLEAIKLKI